MSTTEALQRLINECERANETAVREMGLGLIDTNAIKSARAALAAAPAGGAELKRYEPAVVIDESRGRLTASGSAMEVKPDGRWVRLSDVLATAASQPEPTVLFDDRPQNQRIAEAEERMRNPALLQFEDEAAQPEAPAEPSEREAFEREFPPMDGVSWNGSRYVVEDDLVNSYRADRHLGQWKAWEARAKLATPAPAAQQPAGYVLVPLKMNAEMNRVTAEEGWQWADLLAAAEAITEEQYTEASGPAQQPAELTDAARDVLAERARQISDKRWTPEHDDEHGDGELARAAAIYANADLWDVLGVSRVGWPWAASWWRPSGPRRNLIKAGALILAEIERLDRSAIKAQGGSQ